VPIRSERSTIGSRLALFSRFVKQVFQLSLPRCWEIASRQIRARHPNRLIKRSGPAEERNSTHGDDAARLASIDWNLSEDFCLQPGSGEPAVPGFVEPAISGEHLRLSHTHFGLSMKFDGHSYDLRNLTRARQKAAHLLVSTR
jgi:hypothetical protein